MTLPLLLALWTSPLRAQGPELQQAQKQASRAVQSHKDLKQLREDVRSVADALDDELQLPRPQGAHELSQAMWRRVRSLRSGGGVDPKLDPALARLEALFSTLEQRPSVDLYAKDLLRAVAEELRDTAANARDEEELLSALDDHLNVPVDAEAVFPTDLPLAKFKKLGVVRIFLMKHRLHRPPSFAATTPQALVAGKKHVQIGVQVEGTVTWAGKALDQDYTFNLGDLHVETTPEWRLLINKGMPAPKAGDKVRVRGWTYYDVFHKAEQEYDANDPILGTARATLWEVHNATDIELLGH